MIILGIDPGTKSPGYAAIQTSHDCPQLLTHGVILIRASKPEQRLLEIRQGVLNLISRYKPSAAGVERLYFAKNQKTALAVSEARGLILALLAQYAIPVVELGPNEIKLLITGYGQSDKQAVAKMASHFLGGVLLQGDDNATDAVAIALAALFKLETARRLK